MLQLVTVSVQYAWKILRYQSKFAAYHVHMCFTVTALSGGSSW